MSISATETSITYAGNASSSTPYPITFRYFDSNHISVYADGVEISSSCTFSGDGNDNTGAFTTYFGYGSTVEILVVLDVPLDQPTVLQENQLLPAKTIEEDGFDRLNMQIRRAYRWALGALRLDNSEGGASTGTADHLLGFDEGGGLSEIDRQEFVQLENALDGQVPVWNAEIGEWVANGVERPGGTLTTSYTAPASPEVGDLWYNLTYGIMYLYSSGQWVTITGATIVVGFGANAVTNGIILDTAISDINAAGGGKLIIPSGNWDITPVGTPQYLTNNLHVHFETGAVLTSTAEFGDLIFNLVGSTFTFDPPSDVSVIFDGHGTIDVSAGAYVIGISSSSCISVTACKALRVSDIDFIGGDYHFNGADWLPATDYKVGDVVYESTNVYTCLVKHTSGTDFNPDLTALKWELSTVGVGLAGVGGDSAINPTNVTHTSIDKCTFKGFRDAGVYWGGANRKPEVGDITDDDGGHVSVDSCSFFHCSIGVIGKRAGNNGVVSNCYFEGCRYGVVVAEVGEGQEIAPAKRSTVVGCTFVRTTQAIMARFQTQLIAIGNRIEDFGFCEPGVSDLAFGKDAGGLQLEGASYAIVNGNFFKQDESADVSTQKCIRIASKTDSDGVFFYGGRMNASNNTFDVNNAEWYDEANGTVWASILTDNLCFGGAIGQGVTGTIFQKRTLADTDSIRYYSNKDGARATMVARYHDAVAVDTLAVDYLLASEVQYGRCFKMTAAGTKTIDLDDAPFAGFHFFIYITQGSAVFRPTTVTHKVATAGVFGAANTPQTVTDLLTRYRVEYTGGDEWIVSQ